MSTLKVNTIQNTSGGSSSTPDQIEQGRAKVWVNFNQSGTLSERSSFGVSSISDQGVGRTRINFSTNFADTNYCIVGAIGQEGTNGDHGNNIMIRDGHSEDTFVFVDRVDIECHRATSSVEFMDKKTVCLAIYGVQ